MCGHLMILTLFCLWYISAAGFCDGYQLAANEEVPNYSKRENNLLTEEVDGAEKTIAKELNSWDVEQNVHQEDGKRSSFQPWGGKRSSFQPWGGKRSSFQPWGGKRSSFQPWGGKRSSFQPWGGKRSSFQPWGGKRSSFQPWGGKRSSFQPWGGKRSSQLSEINGFDDKTTSTQNDLKPSAPRSEQKHAHVQSIVKRGAFQPWGGKRRPSEVTENKRQFQAWGGKRSADSVKDIRSFQPWGGKRGVLDSEKRQFQAWGGKRTSSSTSDHPSFTSADINDLTSLPSDIVDLSDVARDRPKREYQPWISGSTNAHLDLSDTDMDAEMARSSRSLAGKHDDPREVVMSKRIFTQWGGEAAQALISPWHSKREFNPWGGKKREFNPWGGKRSVRSPWLQLPRVRNARRSGAWKQKRPEFNPWGGR